MAEKKEPSLPEHLLSLFSSHPSGPPKAVEDTLGSEGQPLKRGRFGRALQLSKFALGTGGRWLLDKAKDAVRSEEDKESQASLNVATQMLKTFGQMRGAAMKVGQMLSYIDDILPPEAKKLLTVLQRDAPAMPWEAIRGQFLRDFGQEPETLFAQIDTTPLAAASIGQVHRATLHDGTPVAVKIQYPGIDEAMKADMKNAKFMGLFQQMIFIRTDTKAIMKELEERLLDECDYLKEADYQEAFAAHFHDHPWIVVPRVHRDRSSHHVLTTTFYQGRGFYQWLASQPSDEERQRATRLFYRFYLGSFYLHGLFNCDPHPGNYLFLDDGRIVFLDYGCTRIFNPERLALWKELCRATFEADHHALETLAVQVGFFQKGAPYDRSAFFELLQYLYQPYLLDQPFDFREHKPQKTFRRMFIDNPNLFKMNMPADAVFLNRIGFGLVSLLSEIGCSLHCRRYVTSYFQGIDPDRPTPEE